MGMRIEFWHELDGAARSALLTRPAVRDDESVRSSVAEIIQSVRNGGDAAIRALTSKFDGAQLGSFRVSEDELTVAEKKLEPRTLAAIDLAITNVRRFHEPQIPASIDIETMPGVRCKRVSHAIDSVGLYVPAGTAPLPSAAIMLAVPAAIAGCPTQIMCTPPRPDGTVDPSILVAASRSGVTDIYKIGGAQAIAAMAYGTETVPKVSKLFGPGNAWVTNAKAQVSTDRDGAAIDMPAGPSEVLIIADSDASAEFVAADLLSQAEHGADSQVVLVTPSSEFAEQVQAQIEDQLPQLSRTDIARLALENSLIILVRDITVAIEVSNHYAPEHLILQYADARKTLPSIRNAGSIFVGPWSPESVGDYCSGTNHVLPTYGAAKTYSGLGVDQFMRQMTVQELTRDGLAALGGAVIALSELEGLDAHAAAVTRRLGAPI